jgi:hypothetical protein
VKSLTREQVQSRKDKAVRFLEDVLDDPERAAEVEAEDVESYADRRKIQLINPRRTDMANGGNGRTKEDLLDEIDDLRAENQDLQDRLDAIGDIVGPEEEDEDDEDSDGSDADD